MYLMFRLLCWFRWAGARNLRSGYCVGSDGQGHVPYVPAIVWVQMDRDWGGIFEWQGGANYGFRWAGACTVCSGYCVGSDGPGHVPYVPAIVWVRVNLIPAMSRFISVEFRQLVPLSRFATLLSELISEVKPKQL